MKRLSLTRRVTLALAATTLLGLSVAAMAETQLAFKSGQTWRGDLNQTVEVTFTEGGKEQKFEGKLLRADKTMVVVEGMVMGKVAKKTIFFADVKGMKTVGAAAPESANTTAAPNTTSTEIAKQPSGATSETKTEGAVSKKALPLNYKGVFLLPLEGMVGTGLRHEEIERMAAEADKFGPGQIIVLEITSPGGMVVESDKIHPLLRDIRKRHRVVAWIKEAISAAAFTALHCDEIYFMHEGAMGSMTMFAGTVAKQGAELEAWLKLAGDVASESGRDPQIARCMIKRDFALSYDIPEGGGPKDAVFRPDTKGQVVLDTPETMLTLTSSQALACGISDGTADTTDELAKLLNLPEWKEANDVGRRLYRDWHALLDKGSEEIPKLVVLMGNKGGGDPIKQLSGIVQSIEKLIEWWDKCPNCMYEVGQKGVGVPPKDYLKRLLAEYKDQLSDLKKQRSANRGQ